MESPKDEHKQLLLLLPPELKEYLQQKALQNQRSLTAEIVVRLLESMEAEKKRNPT